MTIQEKIKAIAENYNKQNGLESLQAVNPALTLPDIEAETIAKEFERLDDFNSNDVLPAYKQFKKECLHQFRLLSKVLKIEFVKENPYNTSQEMFLDIEKNSRLKVFTGGEYHITMKSINKIFRAVHDIFGHYIAKNNFSANGEYKAYKHHLQMFSPLAKKALFTETIAQNCYYKINKKYAIQKSIVFSDCFLSML